MLVTREEVDNLVKEQKSLFARVEAAEKRTKDLEAEKAKWLQGRGQGDAPTIISGSRSDSDESRALRFFGKNHVKELLTVNVAHRRFREVPAELKMLVLNLKEDVDIARFVSQRFHRDPLDEIGDDEKKDQIGRCKSILNTRFGKEVLEGRLKAFGSTVVGAGDEWVPTLISSTFIEEYELRRVLEGRFELVTMPSNPYDLPKLKNVTKARIATEGQTNFSGTNFGTDKIRFSAVKLEEFYPLPEELEEDSAPDIMRAGRSEVVSSQERAAESALINGDSDGTHQDSDTQAGGADLCEKAWDGLRKLAIANSANSSTLDFLNAGVTEPNIATLISRMGKFGVNTDDLMFVVGPVVYNQMRFLPGVYTVEKFGPMATILKGALMAYMGIPIVNSEWFREDLNASGVYDGVTTTRAALSLVNVRRGYVGQKRPIRVKLMPDLPGSDRWLLASYRRVDFKTHAQSATEKSIVYGYNIAK